MKKKSNFLFGFIIVIVFTYIIYEFLSEVNQKKEWAIMQTVESDNNHNDWRIVREPMGISLILLGVKAKSDKTPIVWISLNKKEIKVFPKGVDFILSCKEIDKINEQYKMEEIAYKFLQKKCIN